MDMNLIRAGIFIAGWCIGVKLLSDYIFNLLLETIKSEAGVTFL